MPHARIEIEVEDGCLDAFVAAPEGLDARPPIVLLTDRKGFTPDVQRLALRINAHGYVVLVPEWTRRGREERRDDVDAWLDYLAGERRVDDQLVGLVGWGVGADLALRAAAWRSERVAAVAAYGGRGFASLPAREIAQRINAVVRLGYVIGRTAGRLAVLEAAFCEAGVDFDVAVAASLAPEWSDLADLFGRTLRPLGRDGGAEVGTGGAQLNLQATLQGEIDASASGARPTPR